MKSNFPLRGLLLALAAVAAATLAPAYDLIRGPGGARVTWNNGTIPLVIRMPQTPTFQDGTNYATSVQAAIAAWNEQLANVQLAGQIVAPGAAADNGINEIVLASQIYGDATNPPEDFGPNVLAVTLSYRSGSPRGDGSYQRLESDILFNTGVSAGWNSYRGNLQTPEDIRRVAIHELGHLLGLDHPDESNQAVTAIMNSTVSNTDALQTDDITGAQFLYGRPGGFTSPANNHFANATALTLANNGAQVSGSSIGANKEAGEPNHAPDEPGGASVWWRWTATANGSLTVTTAGSHFDTLLAAYTGGSVNSLTQLAANDDVQNGVVRTSTVTISVTGGTTYYFAVDGWDGEWGSIRLNFSFAPSAVAPTITLQPENRTITAGASAVFFVTATGTAPLTYQWQAYSSASATWSNLQDGARYVGVTGTTLTVFTQSTDLALSGTQYRCLISNAQGSTYTVPVTLTINQPNRPPNAQLTLSEQRAVGQTLTLTLTVSDPDANFSFANLWVDTPVRGTFAIRADNSTLATSSLSSSHAVTAASGTFTRSFALTALDGPGAYTFRLAAVDADGLRTDATPQSITVVPAAPASFSLPVERLQLAVPAGINHLPVRLPIRDQQGAPVAAISVSSSTAWVGAAFDAAASELVLSFATTGLVAASNDAIVQLTRGSETVQFPVQVAVAPVNIVKLIDDPVRSRVYGVHQNGRELGALVVFDPLAGTYLGALTLGKMPFGAAVRSNGSELIALCSASKTIVAVDLATLKVTDSIPLTTYDDWDVGFTWGDIQYGPGTTLYYSDGTWAPVLRVFNRTTRTVVQSILLDAGLPDNSGRYGFGDFAVLPDFSAIYAWGQYGWSAGHAGSNAARLTLGSDGRVTGSTVATSLSYPTFQRDPLDTPVLLAANGDVFMKQVRFAAGTINVPAQGFPSNVYAISPGGEIATTNAAIIEVETGNSLYSLTGQPTVQVITSDYSRLVYFDRTARVLRTVNLFEAIGPGIMGRNLSPANDSIVLAPTSLQWSPQPGTDRYRVYLGTSSASVASATPSSPEYLGEVTAPSISLPNALQPGTLYFWRVDPVNEAGTPTGTVFSFRVATIASSQSKIDTATVTGHAAHRIKLDLSSAVPGKAWSASSADSWIGFEPASSSTPSALNVVLNAGGLSPGVYQGSVTITASDGSFTVPVKLTVDPLAITAMRSMPNSTKVYALSEENASAYTGTSRAYLLEIDALLKRITRAVRVGTAATDLAVHVPDNRIYVANWKTGALLAIDQTTFSLARTYAFRPAQGMGYTEQDVYRLSPGSAGRLMIIEQDQWISTRIFDTVNGTTLATSNSPLYQGRGAYDPAGRYYYHGDSGYSGAGIHRFDTAGDQFSDYLRASVAGIGYYGSSDLLMSEDGSRIFWNGAVLRPDLTVEWDLRVAVVAASRDGRYAFSASAVYDLQTRSLVGSLPGTANISAFNSATGTLVYQSGTAVGFYALPAAAPTRSPANGSITDTVSRLEWAAIPGATGYRVYLGTSAAAVAAAGPQSPEYLGPVSTNQLTLSAPLAAGQYYWRLDTLVGGEVSTGGGQSFTVSALVPSLSSISGITVQGNPDYPFDVQVSTATAGQLWSATAGAAWIRVSPSSGTTPATLRVSIDATALAAGSYQSSVTVTGAGASISIPVSVKVDALAITILKSDPTSAKVYAISESTDENPSRAYLIEADSQAKRILRAVSVGAGVTDLAVHVPEGRLYVTNWKAGALLALDRASLALVRTHAFRPFSYSSYSGTDVYRVAAGVAGRVVVEEYDQWIDIAIYDTTNATLLGKAFVREGGGQFEPNGRYYFHGENNSSGAMIRKFDVAGDQFSQIASARTESASYYGSRTVVVSQDGSRVFWNGGVFDSNLGLVWTTGPEIYSASADGRYAFGETRVFDTVSKSTAYLMPVTTRVSTFNPASQRLVVPNGGSLGFYSLGELSSFVPPSIQSQPASVTVAANSVASFSVVVASTNQSVTYQWQRRAAGSGTWSNLSIYESGYSGVTSATLSLTGRTAIANNGDRYRCVVSNAAGSLTSEEATLTVLSAAAPLQAAHGYHHTAALRWGGTVSVAGRNQEGQLGDGSGLNRTVLIPTLTGIVSLNAGADHLLHLRQDGVLLASGYNEFGTLGTGNTENAGLPVPVADGVAAASGGYRHTLIRKTDGTLWATGRNTNGQLGLGDTTQRNAFTQVASHVISASAGYLHSLYLTSDRKVYAMGWNAMGQLGDGSTIDRHSPVLVGTGYSAISAGYYHSLLLKADGTLWAVGLNNFGQLGDGTTTNRTTPVQIATSVVAMAAGFAHSVFLKSDGTVWAVGRNEFGELGDGTLNSRSTPIQVATGAFDVTAGVHTIGIVKTNGTLLVSGLNNLGQLADGTTTNRAALFQQASGGAGLPSGQPTVSATNSASADRVTLSWTHVPNATHYRLLRGFSDNPFHASVIADRVTGNFYEDLTGVSGFTYRYWVQPMNASGELSVTAVAVGRYGVEINPPVIVTPPATQAATVGADVALSVVATGTAPLSYQWRKDGQVIPGATAATLLLADVTIAAAGDYDVVVSNAAGSITSVVATLTVEKLSQTITFPVISDQHIGPGFISITQATATSGLPVSYSVVSGPALLSNSGNALVPTGTGSVTVRATQAGDATYAPAQPVERTFSILPPRNDAFAEAHLVTGGNVVAFGDTTWATRQSGEPEHVPGTAGTASLWWKWVAPYSNGADVQITTVGSEFDTVLAVYTGSSLESLTLVAANDDRAAGDPLSSVSFWTPSGTTYYIAIDGKNGAKGPARLNIGAIPSSGTAPVFTLQPQPVSVVAGNTATFTINYTGQFPTTLFWQRRAAGTDTWVYVSTSDSFYFSGTGVALTIRPTAAMNGDQFRCVASNNLGTTYSNSALVTVTETLDSWSHEHFTAEELLDPAISGPNADPDGDGFANLLEYALGLDPRAASAAGIPEMSATETEWVFTYTRPAARGDVTYAVEFSTNLTSWTSEGVTHELVSTADGFETWRGRVPLSAGANLFLRLRVSRTNE